MGFGGCVEKCVGFVCVLFKVVKNLKSIYVKKVSWFSLLHTTCATVSIVNFDQVNTGWDIVDWLFFIPSCFYGMPL